MRSLNGTRNPFLVPPADIGGLIQSPRQTQQGGGTEAPTFLGGTDSDTPSFSNSIGLCISTFFPFLDSSI